MNGKRRFSKGGIVWVGLCAASVAACGGEGESIPGSCPKLKLHEYVNVPDAGWRPRGRDNSAYKKAEDRGCITPVGTATTE